MILPPRAVIFDCDGVLVDSEPPTFVLLQENLAQHGLPLTHAQMDDLFLGGTMRGLYDKALALGAELPATWVDDFYALLYARLAKGVALIPGIETVLDALDAARIPYAVGSNGSDEKMRISLGQHPALLARLHGRLFSGQTLGTPKPHPGLYLHCARALHVGPQDCVVIEDSPTGAKAAANAGMRCFGYAATGDGARLAAEGATVFHDMARLPALLGL
ncbi:HAD family phosphatase [Fertoebacter nigrum]|uniref:phosphoglycolate phosphatase n=1 Tax=Fertoeibacter niger TaxID=2656921 RepID=A0A8X8KM63_9RHOB|nr:HAD family phosphatase [Fertoeibacter niger]NUB46039.1 HAD family phosphatase [Fertoeibacter niger]